MVQAVSAQAPKRRAEQQAAQRSNANTLTPRAQIEFPTMAPMPVATSTECSTSPRMPTPAFTIL